MRELTNVEKLTFGEDAVVDPKTDVPVSQSTLRLVGDANHQAGLARERARTAAAAAPSEAVMKEMLALVKDSADDKATAARIGKIQEATATLRSETAANEKSSRELDEKHFAHLKLLANERSTHDRTLAAERSSFEAERAAMLADLTERDAALKKREAEIKAVGAKLAEQVADVDKRLGLIREAAR